MAAAGVSYAVGREPNSQYSETLNGVADPARRQPPVRAAGRPVRRRPATPRAACSRASTPARPGEEGEGDKRIQAYCFRMCLTDAPDNRVPFAKPEGYDPKQYELLGRYLRAGWDGRSSGKFDPVPNRKTDTNNHGAFSTDNIGMNYDYPEASYDRRRRDRPRARALPERA